MHVGQKPMKTRISAGKMASAKAAKWEPSPIGQDTKTCPDSHFRRGGADAQTMGNPGWNLQCGQETRSSRSLSLL